MSQLTLLKLRCLICKIYISVPFSYSYFKMSHIVIASGVLVNVYQPLVHAKTALICSSFQIMECRYSNHRQFQGINMSSLSMGLERDAQKQYYKWVQAGFSTHCSHQKIQVRCSVSHKKHMLSNSVDWMYMNVYEWIYECICMYMNEYIYIIIILF